SHALQASSILCCSFFTVSPSTVLYTLSLHDALPISSATFWASAALGLTQAARRMTRRDIIAAPNVSGRKCRCQANLSQNARTRRDHRRGAVVLLRGSFRGVSYRPRARTTSGGEITRCSSPPTFRRAAGLAPG